MKFINNRISTSLIAALLMVMASFGWSNTAKASSHREAPMIAADPLADNTDLYAFRSPDDTNTVTIIANYIPFESPQGGPNWYTFGENIRYEIHIKNNASTTGDDITYRFTFTHTNEDGTTFFNIRLGKENIKCTYKCEKSTDGGKTFTTIVASGTVPPPNIGPRSINESVGLNTTYSKLMANAITTATGNGGETVFCGPVDDPFFVDLGGAFDLGGFRTNAQGARDGLKGYNVHSICIKIPISSLQKNGKGVTSAKSILDPDFVIGIWASASRPQISTLRSDGKPADVSGNWVQVSRLGMPLTNEVIIPVGMKDKWNSLPPDSDLQFAAYFSNPELELYMDTTKYAGAVPGLSSLRTQRSSYTVLGNVDFGYGQAGLYPIRTSAALTGTALDSTIFGKILLPNDHSPRAVDLLPIFYTGVPNLAPYQLAVGKTKGNPLSAGKPFINNFLPTLGDLLRLNMSTPVTSRTSKDFSSLGIVSAAVLGLTDSRFNTTTGIQFIPNMDGFPNGRRLEDDVTTIELQAVGGVALAAIGLWYDDYTSSSTSPVTPDLIKTLSFTAGPTHNDTSFQTSFPYVQQPWIGFTGAEVPGIVLGINSLNYAPPASVMKNYPNPFRDYTNFDIHVSAPGNVVIQVFDLSGRQIATVMNEYKTVGDYTVRWSPGNVSTGTYFASLTQDGEAVQVAKMLINK